MTGYIFIAVSILYLIGFGINLVRSRNSGVSFRYRPKFLLVAVVALGIGIYCLATGTDLSNFIY